jgi:hypothetical protein
MRVAMLVGLLMVNAIAGLYERGWTVNVNPDASLSDVQAMDDVPPPPSFP